MQWLVANIANQAGFAGYTSHGRSRRFESCCAHHKIYNLQDGCLHFVALTCSNWLQAIERLALLPGVFQYQSRQEIMIGFLRKGFHRAILRRSLHDSLHLTVKPCSVSCFPSASRCWAPYTTDRRNGILSCRRIDRSRKIRGSGQARPHTAKDELVPSGLN